MVFAYGARSRRSIFALDRLRENESSRKPGVGLAGKLTEGLSLALWKKSTFTTTTFGTTEGSKMLGLSSGNRVLTLPSRQQYSPPIELG